MEKKVKLSELNEALITFGHVAYPKSGNVVILMGGAGSGKSFTIKHLLGIDGYVFDTDKLRDLVRDSMIISANIKDQIGIDLKKLNKKNPEHADLISDVVFKHTINSRYREQRYSAIFNAKVKPNLIFDSTLKNASEFAKISKAVTTIGYDIKNIHIVWVVNDVETAKHQNKIRDRTVPEHVIHTTHQGALMTMKWFLSLGDELKQFMDGDIVISLNKTGVDSEIKSSDRGGSFVDKSNYTYVKRRGRPQLKVDEIDPNFLEKIRDYTKTMLVSL